MKSPTCRQLTVLRHLAEHGPLDSRRGFPHPQVDGKVVRISTVRKLLLRGFVSVDWIDKFETGGLYPGWGNLRITPNGLKLLRELAIIGEQGYTVRRRQ